MRRVPLLKHDLVVHWLEIKVQWSGGLESRPRQSSKLEQGLLVHKVWTATWFWLVFSAYHRPQSGATKKQVETAAITIQKYIRGRQCRTYLNAVKEKVINTIQFELDCTIWMQLVLRNGILQIFIVSLFYSYYNWFVTKVNIMTSSVY